MGQHVLTTSWIILLIVWGIYRRIRRNIGWQLLKRRRLIFRLVLFSVIGCVFLAISLLRPISFISDLLGLGLGSALAFYGIQLTKYQEKSGQLFYQPNTWIGSLVTVIFLGRIAYRFYRMYELGFFSGNPPQMEPGTSPMTYSSGTPWLSGLLMIMFAYYIVYYVVLLKADPIIPESNQDKKDLNING